MFAYLTSLVREVATKIDDKIDKKSNIYSCQYKWPCKQSNFKIKCKKPVSKSKEIFANTVRNLSNTIFWKDKRSIDKARVDTIF